jgi:hypothetical protein
MDSTWLTILSILTIIGIVVLGNWMRVQIKAKKTIKILIGACSILLLLIFELNLFVWSAKLSSCFLYFSNQYIAATSEEAKLDLIDDFFPESYDDSRRENVLKDFDNYLSTEPIPVAEVVQITTTPVGPLIVRLDADGNFVKPDMHVSYSAKFDAFSKSKYKIVNYEFYYYDASGEHRLLE